MSVEKKKEKHKEQYFYCKVSENLSSYQSLSEIWEHAIFQLLPKLSLVRSCLLEHGFRDVYKTLCGDSNNMLSNCTLIIKIL